MSYEKDKLDSFVTSASLSTALAPYITSASVSAAIAGLDLAPYMTSNSISAAVATDALTVRGAASVSATMSAAAVTVAGRPIGSVLLGYRAIDNVTSFSFSGSWSDIYYVEIRASYSMSGTGTASLALFTDGGTTPFLVTNSNLAVGAPGGFHVFEGEIVGINDAAHKQAFGIWRQSTGGNSSALSATANSGFVNCIRIAHGGKTLSSGTAIAIGWRTS